MNLHLKKGGRKAPAIDNVLHYHSAYGDVLQHHYEGDAGYDLRVRFPNAAGQEVILPHSHTTLPTGVYIAPPAGMWVMITSRSSTIKMGLIVIPGIIDNGWRGELLISVYNVSNKAVRVDEGMRLAQMIPMALQDVIANPVSLGDLPNGSRGQKGFGSTGR